MELFAATSPPAQPLSKKHKKMLESTFARALKFNSEHEPAGSPKGGQFARKQINTPEFKAWFGDSKVVTSDGKPLVVYHGTGADFDTFDPSKQGENYGFDAGIGFHFSQRFEEAEQAASDYANPQPTGPYADYDRMMRLERDEYANQLEDPNYEPYTGNGEVLMPVYLSIKNPLVVQADRFDRASAWWDSVDKQSYVAEAKALGHDGIIIHSDYHDVGAISRAGYDRETWEIDESARDKALPIIEAHDAAFRVKDNIFIVFEPEQIKSAIGNTGTFNPKDRRITKLSRALKFNPNHEPAGSPKGGQFARSQTSSENFKRWFRDSKIVDENGNPLKVYHGTPSRPSESNNRYVREEAGEDKPYPQFDTFITEGGGVTDSGWLGRGTYFTPDPQYAEEFGDVLMPVYVSMQKPFVIFDDSTNSPANNLRFLQSLQGLKGLPEEFKLDLSLPEPETYGFNGEFKQYYHLDTTSDGKVTLLSNDSPDQKYPATIAASGATVEEAIFKKKYGEKYWGFLLHTVKEIGNSEFTQILKDNGYDGVVQMREPYTHLGEKGWKIAEVLIFEPNQAKSAIGNSGAFDPNDDRITKMPTNRTNLFSVLKANPHHEPAGSPKGGRFAKKPSQATTTPAAVEQVSVHPITEGVEAGQVIHLRDPITGDTMVAFHGTAEAAIESIRKNGLIPKQGRGADTWAAEQGAADLAKDLTPEQGGFGPPRELSVYITPDEMTAQVFASLAAQVNKNCRPILLRLEMPTEVVMAHTVPDEKAKNSFRFAGKIPPEWITDVAVMQPLHNPFTKDEVIAGHPPEEEEVVKAATTVLWAVVLTSTEQDQPK
jgi:ADP-Ribosyltransferase in polyvalent proteins